MLCVIDNMLKKLIYLVGISLLLGCSNEGIDLTVQSEEEVFNKFIVLIDTISTELKKDTSSYLKEAEFHPLYIGEKLDTIQLDYDPREIKYVIHERGRYKYPDSLDLLIVVSTSNFIGSVEDYMDWETADSLGTINPVFYSLKYLSYPVFIENNSDDTLEIGYGEYIPLIIEAMDSSGNWRAIQKPYTYFCGTGMPFYYLPPSEILITSCKLFEGEYKTKLRLVFNKNYYSNEFEGSINYGQFESLAQKY